MLNNGIFLQNRYEIIAPIGSGGMANVYKARDHKLNRFVAVKVLKSEFKDDKSFVSKFRVEAQAAAGLAHANIVNVYDVGEDNGISFIVMELVEGITLKDYIAKKGHLSVREATSIALQVSAGLQAAHNNGIIHRDVKPQNIIISLDGKAKITDFGIARAASSNTITSSAMGSVHYSAPEQTRGGYSDAKSDIYAMGITVYEMLTGHVPFDGDSTVEVALKHLQEELPSPRQFYGEIPYAVEQIVLKCTQKSPDRRYQNMEELIRDLRESLVNPEGNFVVIPKLDNTAHTVLLSEEEVARIRSGSDPIYDRNQLAGRNSGAFYQTPRPDRYQPEASLTPEYSARDDFEDTYDDEDEYDDLLQEDFDDDFEERRRNRRQRSRRGSGERAVVVISIFAALAVAAVVLFFVGRTTGIIPGKNPETEKISTQQDTTAAAKAEVPSILGLSEAAAQNLLKENKLGYHFEGEKNSNDYPKGQVCEQTVPSGESVDQNSTIGYYVSLGSEQQLTVPELTNVTSKEAETALTSMGLNVSVDNTRYSSTIDEGHVITTNPGYGSPVKAGDTVTVFISQGPDSSTVTVPQLTTHYVDDAKTMLSNLGLYCYITYQDSETVEKGLIIAQDIAEGTSVQTGTTVTVTVSNGSGKETDIIVDANDGGTWMCYAQLNAPEDWAGEPVKITLTQGDTTTTIFEGETSFPYILNVEGQAGVSTGQVYVYTLNPQNTEEVTATTLYDGVVFSRVEDSASGE